MVQQIYEIIYIPEAARGADMIVPGSSLKIPCVIRSLPGLPIKFSKYEYLHQPSIPWVMK